MHRIIFVLIFSGASLVWATDETDPRKSGPRQPVPLAKRSNQLNSEPWQNVPTNPLTAAELDHLINNELAKDNIQPTQRINDDAFVRRVYLDLTGRLPLPADAAEFAADQRSDKRAKLVDHLIDSDEYVDHWTRYWREVIGGRYSDPRIRAMLPSLDLYLRREIATNTSWDKLAKAMITASGELKVNEPSADAGVNFFLMAHYAEDQTVERAAETSRVFLGIQIQCAQCHDHPFDAWKQEQFHELAAYYAKVRYQVVGLAMPPNITTTLANNPGGRHKMPDKDNPTKGKVMQPRFLDGTAPTGSFITDGERRGHLANAVAGPANFWFAAAFVNRMWGEFMGQAFATPIDDLGPGRPVVMPEVLSRLAASFKGSGYDIKALHRLICTSDTYQRELRPGESRDSHLHFAAMSPNRLQGETLWNALTSVLGQAGFPAPGNGRGFPFALSMGIRGNNPQGLFINEFRFDPSTPPEHVEGSIPQALLLMNNAQIADRIKASGSNLLARVLESYPNDKDAIRIVYQRTLARKPTDHELDRTLSFIKTVGKRSEAFEDVLWALLNSAEFLSRR